MQRNWAGCAVKKASVATEFFLSEYIRLSEWIVYGEANYSLSLHGKLLPEPDG